MKSHFLPIILTFDEAYTPYASVTITSILLNANADFQYEINILFESLSQESRQLLSQQVAPFSNFKLKFIQLDQLNHDDFHLNSYMTISTYFRLFIPKILSHYDRILYLDCDLVVCNDFSDFATLDFQDKLVAAVKDPYAMDNLKFDKGIFPKNYGRNVLQLSDDFTYFNAGVILFNLKKFRELHLEDLLLNTLREIPSPILQDQDIINAAVSRNGGALIISDKYNLNPKVSLPLNFWRLRFFGCNFLPFFKKKVYQYIKQLNPVIYHFIGADKPWMRGGRIDDSIFYHFVYQKITPHPYKNAINRSKKLFKYLA